MTTFGFCLTGSFSGDHSRLGRVPQSFPKKEQRCYQDQGVRDQDQTKTRQAETETETKTREAETKTNTRDRDRDLCCLGHDKHTQTVFIHRHLNIALQ